MRPSMAEFGNEPYPLSAPSVSLRLEPGEMTVDHVNCGPLFYATISPRQICLGE